MKKKSPPESYDNSPINNIQECLVFVNSTLSSSQKIFCQIDIQKWVYEFFISISCPHLLPSLHLFLFPFIYSLSFCFYLPLIYPFLPPLLLLVLPFFSLLCFPSFLSSKVKSFYLCNQFIEQIAQIGYKQSNFILFSISIQTTEHIFFQEPWKTPLIESISFKTVLLSLSVSRTASQNKLKSSLQCHTISLCVC